jgi:hypothetical protein
MKKWERFAELAEQKGINVELQTENGFINPTYSFTENFTSEASAELLNELQLQAGLLKRIEGPWKFTVDVPEF